MRSKLDSLRRELKKMAVQGGLLVMLMILFISISKVSIAQTKLVTLNLKQCQISELFQEIRKQTNYRFVYNEEHVQSLAPVDVQVTNQTVRSVLEQVLKTTDLIYRFEGEVIYLQKRKPETAIKENRLIKGKVTDAQGDALPGVTVVVKGTTFGVVTDTEGIFSLSWKSADTLTLVFSFVGMKTETITLKPVRVANDGPEYLRVVLKEENVTIEDVVVTGYANINKQSFTGNVKAISGEELKKISQTNVLKSLQVLDPSFRIAVNNEMGSNPNTLPDISIRGASGIGVTSYDASNLSETALKNNPNLPTFIMDGFEVSVEKLYDMDVNRIESITLLKDAAATAIYGSRAANGVVVITTIAPKPGELLINYSYNLNVQVPDLSDYNLMNAREKLEAEKQAGLFDGDSGIRYYNEKARLIEQGVETDWLSKPLENTFSSKHYFRLEGGSRELRYAIDLNYYGNNGVMKDSYRRTYGASFELQYRVGKLMFRNAAGYTGVESQESPYGVFSTYTTMNPYLPYLDEDGTMLEKISAPGQEDVSNPLYDATLGSYDETLSEEFYDNFSVQYYLTDKLNFKGTLALMRTRGDKTQYTSPDAGKYKNTTYKGELTLGDTKELTIDGSLFAYYNDMLGLHSVNLAAGINIQERKTTEETFYLRDLPAGEFVNPQFAGEMAQAPYASDQTSRLFGAMLSLNYTYNNLYLADLTGRLDGNSSFGSKKRFAPFWSVGAGINIHNYAFMSSIGWLSELKIRGSYGITGKANFPANTARTVYEMNSDYVYATGVGGNITAMGNEQLKWERTNITDVGFTLGLLKDRLHFEASYYNRRTVDLIADMYIPASSGFLSYKDNIGEVVNKGFELDARVKVIGKRETQLFINGNLAANKNRIDKISDALKSYNEKVEAEYDDDATATTPMIKYEEGASTTAIYAMPSLGIDPQSGKELFLYRNGTVGTKWIASENIAVGDTEPKANGTFGLNFYHKGLTVDMYFRYTFGGQQYNQTLQSKIENADIRNNVDKRVFTDRWKEVGDVCSFKSLADYKEVTKSTSRFVQDDNTLTLQSLTVGYELPDTILRKLHFSQVKFSFTMNDVFYWSTIKQERGLSYPFARAFGFSINVGL